MMTWAPPRSTRQRPLHAWRAAGFTLLEVLVVVGLLGAMGAIAAVGVQRYADAEQERAALDTFRGALAYAAGAADARGVALDLVWRDDLLHVEDADASSVRSWAFPRDTITSLEPGTLVSFAPSGRIDDLRQLAGEITFTVRGRVHTVAVSLIGQSQVTP